MKGLDLRKFHKVREDAKLAILSHPDGHEIRIAKSVISPSLREQLSKLKMADGGDVEKKDESITATAKSLSRAGEKMKGIKGVHEPSRSNPQGGTSVAGEYSQFGAPGSPMSGVPTAKHLHRQKLEEMKAMPKPPLMADGTNPDDSSQAPLEISQVDPNSTEGKGLAQLTPQTPSQPMDPESPAPAIDRVPASQMGPPAPEAGPAAIDDYSQNTAGDPNQINPAQIKQELTQEDQAWQNDLNNGHIHPETYSSLFAKKDTLGKIGTIFGLMMSGAGSGLSHQPNALLGMMNQQIKNDLDAQVQSKTNAQNYLKINLQQQLQQGQLAKMVQEGKLNEAQARAALINANVSAYALANIQMNRAALHKMTQNIQKLPLGSPQRVQAENTLAMMFQGVNNENFNIADRAAAAAALAGTATQSGSGSEAAFQRKDLALRMSGNDKLAQNMEDKHIPGIKGEASIPLNSADREQINSGITFQQQLDRFRNWTQAHSGDLSPADINEGMALSAGLNNAYRQATHGGVFKESENQFIGKVIDEDPTKFFNSIRVMPKLDAVKRDSAAQLDQLLKSKGFAGYSGSSSGGSQPQYKIVNGVKYKRGPKGEAIRVK